MELRKDLVLRRIGHAFAALFMVTMLIPSIKGSAQLVLCIGLDGHVALERAHDAACKAEPEGTGGKHGEPGMHAFVATLEERESCLDIPLPDGFGQEWMQVSRTVPGHSGLPADTDAHSIFLETGQLSVVVSPNHFYILNPSLRSLCTVILLS